MTSPAEYRELALDFMREADREDAAAMRLTTFGLASIWMSVAVELDKHAMQADDDPRAGGSCHHRLGMTWLHIGRRSNARTKGRPIRAAQTYPTAPLGRGGRTTHTQGWVSTLCLTSSAFNVPLLRRSG